jgi:TP901 family phage tail tape measure protein
MAIFPIGAQVGADTSQFIGAMGGATRGLSAFTGAAGLGALAIGVFAGAAGLGVAITAAREFQTEMIKLNTLVGIQIDQVNAWESAIKSLAVETGKAPADLARAMFAITSGGARGQQAMELLEQAAKASAIGLGDMTSIGRVATAMLQAFGDEGLTAQKAIDVMVTTVRLGNLSAESLAGAFSRVLGPAKALGSSVEEIGAFMSTFTRLGGSTEEAATGLLNMFQLLIKPPKDAREAMLKYGISIDEVRDTLEREGLPAALAVMKGAIGDNVDAMGEMIPSVRALIAFLNTAGLQAEGFASDLMEIEASLGATDEAFDTWSTTADAALKRFTAQTKSAAIAVGDIFLPPLILLLDALTKVIGLLELSADGWALIFGAVGKAGEELKEFLALAAAVPESVDSTVQSVEDFVSALDGMSEINLESLRDLTAFTIRELRDAMESGKLTAEQATDAIAKMERAQTQQRAITAALAEQTAAREKLNEELRIEEERLEALKQPNEEELENIEQIVDALQDELNALTMTRAAIIDTELAELKASDTTREAVRILLTEIAAQNARTEALKEAEQEKEKAARAETRRLETLKRTRERTAATELRRREREDLARLNAEMQEAMRIATQFADTIGDAFFEVTAGTKGVAEAFGEMVTEILKQMARLAIQRGIVEPLIGAFLGQFAPQVPGAGAVSGGGGNDFGLPEGLGSPDFGLPTGLSSSANLVSSGGGTIVQQNITFSPSLIDGASGARFLEQNAGAITGIIGDAARNSGQAASAFSGQNQ